MTALRFLFLLIFILASLPGCDEPRYLPVLTNQDAGMSDTLTFDAATQNDARIDAVADDAGDASFTEPEPELHCDGPTCYCEDGTAITLSRVCDRYRQCAGGEDEIHCGWPEIESTCVGADCRCPDGAALTSRQICNGFITCANAEDEAGCGWPELPLGHDRAGNWVASCNNGDAIPARHRCDQRFNCPGGEDEAGCVTALLLAMLTHVDARATTVERSTTTSDATDTCTARTEKTKWAAAGLRWRVLAANTTRDARATMVA